MLPFLAVVARASIALGKLPSCKLKIQVEHALRLQLAPLRVFKRCKGDSAGQTLGDLRRQRAFAHARWGIKYRNLVQQPKRPEKLLGSSALRRILNVILRLADIQHLGLRSILSWIFLSVQSLDKLPPAQRRLPS